MPFMGAGTVVRPLALYPLLLLLPLLLVRLWRNEIKNPLPGPLTVLAAFVLAAIAATALGAAFAPVELRGSDYFDRALRAFITLGIGLAFFLAATWMNRDETDIRFTVRWLMVGLAAHLVWGAIQFVGLNNGYRAELKEIQEIFSVRGLVKNKRISGFTFEPSWLASQLATLYLPWLTAHLLTLDLKEWLRQTRPNRLRSLIMPALLLASLAALLATYSRSGLAVTAFAAGVTLLVAGRGFLHSTWKWFLAGFRFRAGKFPLRGMRAAAGRVLLVLTALAILASVGAFLADKGYIARFWTSDFDDFWRYVVDVSLGPRVAYAVGGMRAFDQNPLTGVGLGASGFYIYPNIPDGVLMGVPEIAEALSPASGLFPNPKNLYVRLLGETGLLGFSLFIAFWLGLLADALDLLRRNGQFSRFVGAAGLFALSALMAQAFSQDSFALPELWLNSGILAGVFYGSKR
jgi:O-antigen ligase